MLRMILIFEPGFPIRSIELLVYRPDYFPPPCTALLSPPQPGRSRGSRDAEHSLDI